MLKEIGTYLATQNVGTVGTDIFLGQMPDQPDNCVSLFEYAGSPPDLHWNGEYPGLQVRVRSTSYSGGRAKIGDVMDALHGLHEKVLPGEADAKGDNDDNGEPSEPPASGTRYLLIRARGSPEVLKRDASDRVEFVINFEIIKER
ncbi:minor capsid protein [Candidatus Darwinibacter acetoxidans]